MLIVSHPGRPGVPRRIDAGSLPLPRIASGHGTLLVDVDGVEYLDADCGATIIGHAHPAVAAALAGDAARRPAHRRFANPDLLDYASQLLDTLPGELNRVIFTDGGQEATALALSVVRAATGATGIVGSGLVGSGAAGSGTEGILGTAPGAVLSAGAGFSTAMVASAATELRSSELGFAGWVVDTGFAGWTVNGTEDHDGVPGGAPDAAMRQEVTDLHGAARAVHDVGGLVVADESWGGLGRLGTGLWAFTSLGFTPDVLVIGCVLADGLPLGAVVMTAEVAAAAVAASEAHARNRGTSPADSNGTSHAAAVVGAALGAAIPSPVSVAVAAATLDVIRGGTLIESARSVGDYLRLGLALLCSADDSLGLIHGRGLLIGVDVLDANGAPDPRRAQALTAELQRRRVLVGTSGVQGNVLTVRPPLGFGVAHADRVIEQLFGALSATAPPLAGAAGAAPARPDQSGADTGRADGPEGSDRVSRSGSFEGTR